MSLIAKELLRYARDLLVVKTGNTRMIIDTEESIARMSEDAKECEVAFLTAVIGILSEADAALRYSVSPRIALETVCLKAALLSSSDYNALEQRISRLENGMHASVSTPAAPPVKESVSAPKEHKTPQTAPPDALSLWGKLVTYMREHESMKLYSLLGSHSDVETDGDKLIVWCNDDNYLTFSEPETAQAVRRALADVSEGTELVIDKRKRADSEKLIDKIKSMMSGVDVKIKRKK